MANNPQLQVVAYTPYPDVDGNRRMAPDPEATELLQSQLILPFSLGSTMHDFLHPLLTPPEVQKIKSFFPCIPDQYILAGQKEIFIKQFVLSKRPFSNPPKNTPEFISWLDKVQSTKGQFWKEIGIFDFMKLFQH